MMPFFILDEHTLWSSCCFKYSSQNPACTLLLVLSIPSIWTFETYFFIHLKYYITYPLIIAFIQNELMHFHHRASSKHNFLFLKLKKWIICFFLLFDRSIFRTCEHQGGNWYHNKMVRSLGSMPMSYGEIITTRKLFDGNFQMPF